ncbi:MULTISPECIES: amino acid permease [Bifidobacterium]|uniref:Amino acid permease n=1 Tax=Bifidobacterium tissieri TaxID=1630162 RepID=A0A261FHY9_9BIFI|nr:MULTISPECIES: amino acid permease [Bifidobacterium]KAA8831136.1 amino acid permease [Bifidobacterium tissieri]KAA8833208.1 amino acid permease [Bifidobacterium tissieri]OZG58781.1 amino acid permease [Bifidobacterium tissieri]TPF97936.1 amino acid permease [Bifidobacterium sp. UTCIF-39]
MNLLRTKTVEQTIAETDEADRKLKRNLKWWDLAIMGVAVAVGAGIFSVGAQAAAYHAGPAVIISFLIAGIVCGAAVMCYAEFASMIPVAGSAYTFTYTTVGEMVAWIIGWDLILEMLMAGSVISKYWGVYLNDFFRLMGWNLNTGVQIGSFTLDVAPIIIVAFFTVLLVYGTRLGARVDGAMTVLKIAIVFFVVIVGFFYVKASNFTPFIPPSEPASSVQTASSEVTGIWAQPLWQWATGMTPSIYGIPGILSGAALVFFAFIGFDVVATAAEETDNPKKAVPLGIGTGMLLIIVMYVAVAVVTTGMVSYKDLAKAQSPSLATAFELVGANWAAKIISFGIVLGLATVVMVLLLGLTRIVFAMSRDGLLPRGLSKTGAHGTPAILQIACGVVVALVAAFFDIGVLSDMVNIGTLSAFTLVAISVPIMRRKRPDLKRSFVMPGNPWVPILIGLANLWLMLNLTVLTWVRFVVWLVVGFAIYFAYGYRHSRLGLDQLKGDIPADAR